MDTGNFTRRGSVRIPPHAYMVTDADEEVFLLYTDLAGRKAADGSSVFRGLGHIDSQKDTLLVTFAFDDHRGDEPPEDRHASGRTRGKKGKSRRAMPEEQTLEVEIVQDKTALRTRKGDTGSVLWQASVDFAQTVLQQLRRQDPDGLLDPEVLRDSHVLELGAGTGLLSIVLSPAVHHYTVTDIEELVPLIRKNIAHNASTRPTSPSRSKQSLPPPLSNVTAMALDWITLQNAPPTVRAKLVPQDPVDLLLVVDCIYHPSLLPPLLTTIDHMAIPGHTAVLVAMELRAEDVVRGFLQGWLEKSPNGEWEIWSVGGVMDGPYAVWVGWKRESPTLQ